jgi:two-component system chemotaxis sensor kinase CheA
MNSLLNEFIAEARELLDDTNANLLALEKEPDNAEIINTSFRAMHTLKGDSGLVGLPEITHLLHAAEDVLDGVRQKTIVFERDIIDVLLQVVDCVGGWLDHLDETETLPETAAEQSAPLAARLRGFTVDVDTPNAVQTVYGEAPKPEKCTWLNEVPADIRDQLHGEMIKTDGSLFAIEFRPEEDCFFRGEDPFFLMQQVQGTAWRSVFTQGEAPPLDEIDPFRCHLAFRALSMTTREDISNLFRYVLSQVQIIEITSDFLRDDLASTAGQSKNLLTATALIDRGLSIENQTVLKQVLKQLESSIQPPGEPEILAARIRSTAAILQNCVSHLRIPSFSLPIEEAMGKAIQEGSAAPLCRQISDLLTMLNRDEALRISDIAPGMSAPPASTSTSTSNETVLRPKSNEIRILKVDQARIDKLMNLVGEMVVAKNSLPYLAERALVVFGARDLSKEIKEHYSVINRITQDLQDAMMEVRMLPVSHVLQRFPRLVRDMAKKLNKEIELILEGEETELDKNIVEALGDPLMHIVRNSLDHGVETTKDRIAAGKPAKGTIRIKATQEDGRALIVVSDDGKGIDPERVKRKAFEQNILSEEEMKALSDAEAVQLVFRAGFSTVDKVTDLSGRGVGMDVVRTAVEQVGGTVQLQSAKGKGTQVVLSLPMSMASTRAMIVEADSQEFGVPLEIIVETFRVPAESIFRIKHKEVLVRRDCTMPVIRLRTMLNLGPEPDLTEDREYAILIARIFNENVALLVDDFADIVEVIEKPMEGVISDSKAFTSMAILGNGTILLMLNLEGLISCQSSSTN